MTHTRDQLEAKTDDELDVIVATRVMGWEEFSYAKGHFWDGYKSRIDWSPTTSWKDMGEVWERMKFLCKSDDGLDPYNYQLWTEFSLHLQHSAGSELTPFLWFGLSPRAVAIAAILAVQEMKQ